MATISTRTPIIGFPFANIFSVSDGTVSKSSGSPYLYMTPLDVSVIDLKVCIFTHDANLAKISIFLLLATLGKHKKFSYHVISSRRLLQKS